jgi:hypothetical protein
VRLQRAAREAEERSLATRAPAEQLTRRGATNLTDAVRHALGEAVFAITDAGGDPQKIAAALTGAGHVLASLDRNDIAREKLQTEIRRAQSLQREAALDPETLYLYAAQDVLKRLRSRQAVREVLDPIRHELIEELANASAPFAQHIEERLAKQI